MDEYNQYSPFNHYPIRRQTELYVIENNKNNETIIVQKKNSSMLASVVATMILIDKIFHPKISLKSRLEDK